VLREDRRGTGSQGLEEKRERESRRLSNLSESSGGLTPPVVLSLSRSLIPVLGRVSTEFSHSFPSFCQ
jgi:hypothetical protein